MWLEEGSENLWLRHIHKHVFILLCTLLFMMKRFFPQKRH